MTRKELPADGGVDSKSILPAGDDGNAISADANREIVLALQEAGKILAARGAKLSLQPVQNFINAAGPLAKAHSGTPSDSVTPLGRCAALAMQRFQEIDAGLGLEGSARDQRLPLALFGDRGKPLQPFDDAFYENYDAVADTGGASSERGHSLFLSAIFGRVHKTHDELAAEAAPAEPWAFPELFMGLARRVYSDQAPERKIAGTKAGGRIVDEILTNVKRWQRAALKEPGQR